MIFRAQIEPEFKEKYPLVFKYFGEYLALLLSYQHHQSVGKVRFLYVLNRPERLERRLSEIVSLDIIQSIVDEVGNPKTIAELDERLVNAWAEIRTVSQLQKEGYVNIKKVREIADLTAVRGGTKYAFQVTRITTTLQEQLARRKIRTSTNEPNIVEVYEEIGPVLGEFFWNAIERKNSRFAHWRYPGWIRCIVVVTSDEVLSTNTLIRHIACREIGKNIVDVVPRQFEELLWLPDVGNGAWFKANANGNVSCYADWRDALFSDCVSVHRREVALEAWIPAWKDELG